MAFIEKTQVQEFRNKIKKEFPAKDGWKFSITRKHFSGIDIAILQGPVNFLEKYRNGQQIMPRNDDHPYLQKIYNIANSGNYDNSDAMTDYFDIGWYVWMSVGAWDKEYNFVKR